MAFNLQTEHIPRSLLDQVHTKDALITDEGVVIYAGPDFHFLPHDGTRSGFTIDSTTNIRPCNTEERERNNRWEIPKQKECLIISSKTGLTIQYKVVEIQSNHYYFSFTHQLSPKQEDFLSKKLLKNIHPTFDKSSFILESFNQFPAELGILDLQKRYIYLNKVAVPDEDLRQFLVEKTEYDYCELKKISPERAIRREQLLDRVIETHVSENWIEEQVETNGVIRSLSRTISPIFDKEQQLVALLGYGIDVTHEKNAEHLAKLNEKRFRSLFEQNMAGVFRTTEKGEILEANQAYLDIFGFESIEALRQYRSIDFYPSIEDRNTYLTRLKAEGSLKNFLLKNRRLDGTIITLLLNVSYRIIDELGYIEGTLIDISALQQANETLKEQKESLEQLAFFIDQTSDAISVADEDGNFVFLNKAAKDRLGIHELNTPQSNVFTIQPWFTSVDGWKKHIIDLKEMGELRMETAHMNFQTKEKTPVEISVIPREFNGKTFVITASRDITERLASQKLIAEKNKFVTDLTSAVNTSSLVSVTDEHGIILSVNENFSRISGYTEQELIGSNHNIVNSGFHTMEFWSGMYKTILAGNTWQGEIRNRKKNGNFYWLNTVIYPIKNEEGKPFQFMSIRQEITAAKENESIIKKQVNFQELVMRTSSKLINLDPEKLDDAIDTALREIGEFVDADRAYIFEYNLKKQTTSNLYEWCREGIDPQIETLQNIPFSEVPRWVETHFRGEIMDIPSVEALPESNFKHLLEIQDIKSLIAIPMMDGKTCTGFIGFDSVRDQHTFNETDKIILDLFSEMVVNINKRTQFIQAIEDANRRYVDINEGLEKIIAEKTAKNNELTQNMANQDKLAMIGEITAGITHDLNTPIGAIKVGTESIQYTLKHLFDSILAKCTLEQLHFACALEINPNVQMFIGGLQTMRETQAMHLLLEEQFPQLGNREEIASALVKARIQPHQSSVLSHILQAPDPLALIDLVYHIHSIRTFISTVLEAGDKAASVIKNLRFYLKEGDVQQKTNVRLYDNIKTVLNVFSHQLKHGIDLKFDIAEELIVMGYETKLYQLWSNLIKNAIDAIGDSGELRIEGHRTEGSIVVKISNTGQPIPKETQEKIFQKFFTTKGEKNGTGLGLSIVSKVVEEHHAKINVESNEEFTSFIVTFEA
jgi:PAS domain S-box-containing protein